jgi:hypothetical protein
LTDKPIVIDEVAETDVYIATLELRSVGTSKNIYPIVRFSHMFASPPDEDSVPYSYRAILQIADKIGAIAVEDSDIDVGTDADSDDINEAILQMEEALKGREDDTVH